MSDSGSELTYGGLSARKNLGPLHPDFPRDPTTERFQRTLQHAVADLNVELHQLEIAVMDFESAGESASMIEARKCGNQVKKFLNKVIGLILRLVRSG
jgi:hypothetical protein